VQAKFFSVVTKKFFVLFVTLWWICIASNENGISGIKNKTLSQPPRGGKAWGVFGSKVCGHPPFLGFEKFPLSHGKDLLFSSIQFVFWRNIANRIV